MTNMYEFANELFPICRSIMGPGIRQSFEMIKERIGPSEQCIISTVNVPTGTKVYDWEVPNEWEIRSATLKDQFGRTIIDFADNNLHVVSHSTSIDRWIDWDELKQHLHTLPNQPNAIPYVTSYYHEYWGFCLTQYDYDRLKKKGQYHVKIDSTLKPGILQYIDIIIPGDSDMQVFFSTYICHPSMANNEISGPVVVTELVKWLMKKKDRRYTYRIVFIPETIGSIAFLAKNFNLSATGLRSKMIAGVNVSCVGDERCYSYVPSKKEVTLSDRCMKNVLWFTDPSYNQYTFLDRGGDERQYCSPGIDLPVVTFSRSKFKEYPEYHTSFDDMSMISQAGLEGSLEVLKNYVRCLEANDVYNTSTYCEPNLGKRGFYPLVSDKSTAKKARTMKNFLAYARDNDLFEISEKIGVPVIELLPLVKRFMKEGLIKRYFNNSWRDNVHYGL